MNADFFRLVWEDADRLQKSQNYEFEYKTVNIWAVEFKCRKFASLLIITKYIEQIGEKMSNSSPSESISQQLSPETPRRCKEKKSKHKKIEKLRKNRTQKPPADTHSHNRDVEELLNECAQEYFGDSLPRLLDQLKAQQARLVHYKHLLGDAKNVYGIRDYENCQRVAEEYLSMVRSAKNSQLVKVGLRVGGKSVSFGFRQCAVKGEEKKKHQSSFLDRYEYLLLKKRREFRRVIDDQLARFNETENFSPRDKEILALHMLGNSYEIAIDNALTHLTHLPQHHSNPLPEQTSPSSDQYIALLFLLNLRRSFDETPLDLLNYFKVVENREKNIHDDVPLRLLSSKAELREFLKSKKHRTGKNHNPLQTCCGGCFSNHYEIYNPLQGCTECGTRMHQLCQSLEKNSKCQSCKASKAACILCHRAGEKGLLLKAVEREGVEEYAHIFCLLVNGLWKIEREKLVELVDRRETRACCKFCEKEAAYHVRCRDCREAAHGLCAYLSGCSFSVDEQGGIGYSCCTPKDRQARLSLERKYKMNYQRMLFEKEGEFYAAIEQSC